MNASQQRAVDYFKGFMQRQLNTNPDYGDVVDKWEVTATDYGTLWILATTDMTKLGEGNLLRFLDRQHWFVSVGKRGGLVVKSAPKSFKQFNGKGKAFGMTFDC